MGAGRRGAGELLSPAADQRWFRTASTGPICSTSDTRSKPHAPRSAELMRIQRSVPAFRPVCSPPVGPRIIGSRASDEPLPLRVVGHQQSVVAERLQPSRMLGELGRGGRRTSTATEAEWSGYRHSASLLVREPAIRLPRLRLVLSTFVQTGESMSVTVNREPQHHAWLGPTTGPTTRPTTVTAGHQRRTIHARPTCRQRLGVSSQAEMRAVPRAPQIHPRGTPS